MRELTIKGIIGSNLKLGENPHICLPKITIEVLKYYQELMKAYKLEILENLYFNVYLVHSNHRKKSTTTSGTDTST